MEITEERKSCKTGTGFMTSGMENIRSLDR